GAVVAFEADAMDAERAHGWSVLVVGLAELITEEERIAAARSLPLPAWDRDDGDHFTRIPGDYISGRVYRAGELPAASA
ncbi:MAG: pyridoxamine 5'-phosphate oxidase family protein, partial [Acidimicrobiia bacterium]